MNAKPHTSHCKPVTELMKKLTFDVPDVHYHGDVDEIQERHYDDRRQG